MADGNNKKRQNIISLMYIIFICLSVLQIKVTSIDSEKFSTKTYDHLINENEVKNSIIDSFFKKNDHLIFDDSVAMSYVKVSYRIDSCRIKFVKYMNYVNAELTNTNTSITDQFFRTKVIENIYRKDSGIFKIQDELFALDKYLLDRPIYKSTQFNQLVPISKTVSTSKSEAIGWVEYLFFHKPAGISYNNLLRIQLLLSELQLSYKQAALNKIGFYNMFFSKQTGKYILVEDDDSVIKKENIGKLVQLEKPKQSVSNDSLLKTLINSLNTDNIYAGIKVNIFENVNIGKDLFKVYITPQVTTMFSDRNLKVIFPKVGEYIINIDSYNLGEYKPLFTRKIQVLPLPDPTIMISEKNLNNYSVSKNDLLTEGKLTPVLKISKTAVFPGRINSFKMIRLHNGIEKDYVINNGELFQFATLKLIQALDKNDIVIFSNINLLMVDGSTRNVSPLIYKISDL